VRPHDTHESGECPAIVGMLFAVPCVGINAMMLCKCQSKKRHTIHVHVNVDRWLDFEGQYYIVMRFDRSLCGAAVTCMPTCMCPRFDLEYIVLTSRRSGLKSACEETVVTRK